MKDLVLWGRRLLVTVIIIGFFLGGAWSSETGPVYGQDSGDFLSEAFSLVLSAQDFTGWIGLTMRVLVLALVVALYVRGPRAGRLADLLFALTYVWLSVGNNLGFNAGLYGTIVITGNLIGMAGIAALWLSALVSGENHWNMSAISAWRYWIVPLMLLAYAFPINAESQPGYSWAALSQSFGVWFCPTTPVVLGLLTLIYPHVHRPLFGLMSFIGLIIGLMNWTWVFLVPGATIWFSGVLHAPLVIISAYGLLLPLLVRKPDNTSQPEPA